jgi:hypothetical protein
MHESTWWRAFGPLVGWYAHSSDDDYDNRVHGTPYAGALAGRFVSFSSLSNSPGEFIAKDVTRSNPEDVLFLTNNVHVVNLACTIVNVESVRILGQTLVLDSDGTATKETIITIESVINSALHRAMLPGGNENHCSSVQWIMKRGDDLRGPAAIVRGILSLGLAGTISHVDTKVEVQ